MKNTWQIPAISSLHPCAGHVMWRLMVEFDNCQHLLPHPDRGGHKESMYDLAKVVKVVLESEERADPATLHAIAEAASSHRPSNPDVVTWPDLFESGRWALFTSLSVALISANGYKCIAVLTDEPQLFGGTMGVACGLSSAISDVAVLRYCAAHREAWEGKPTPVKARQRDMPGRGLAGVEEEWLRKIIIGDLPEPPSFFTGLMNARRDLLASFDAEAQSESAVKV